jgi:outer membrane receptor protein involved in Fe transport
MKFCMHKPIVLLGIVLFGAITSAHTQNAPAGSISVKIADAAGSSLPYASVVVRKVTDSALVKGQMSDTDGKCAFEKIAPGTYFIEASQMGYTTYKSDKFHIDAAHARIDLKTITLQLAPKSLQGVEVTAQKPFIERSEGKTILNVESSIAAAGNTAMDILRRAPGVTVDKDDNLLLKGKQGVTVMIDGKLTYLSSESLAELLKSMQAESISQIEIITSPGAKYDAAGTSGIINIKTKKGQLVGLNGSLNAGFGGGRYLFYNAGGNINWRTKRLNVFGSLNMGDRQSYNTRYLYRTTGGEVPMQFQQDVFQTNDFLNRSIKAGVDYNISDKQTIGVLVNGYSNAFWRKAPSATQIANKGGTTDSILYTAVDANNRFKNISLNLNYKLKLDTTGGEFSVDADYAKFNNQMGTVLSDSLRNVHDGTILQRSSLRTLPFTNITIKSFKADLVKALNKTSKIETGFKISMVSTDNTMRYDSLQHGEYVPVLSQYDQFIYKEQVVAGYLVYKKQFKQTDFVLGLRLEHTTADANSISLKNNVKNSYLDYFPNVTIDHKFSENHRLSLAYSKRINRPGYGQLNPFLFFLDKYTFFRGNSYLTPEYTHNTEMSYIFKHKYIATLGYSHTSDVINEYLSVNDVTKITLSTNKNLGTQNTYSLNVTLPFDPVKWWNTSNNIGVYYNQYKIKNTPTDFTTEKLSYSFNSTNTFTLPHDYKLELSGWYEGPNVYGIFVARAMWAVSAGIQKTVLEKKGTLKLNVNDIFASNRFRGIASYDNVYLNVNNRWQNRTVNLSFTYRFGNNKIQAARERQTGTADELKRAGN